MLIGEGETTFVAKEDAAPPISCARDDLLDLEFRVSSETDRFFVFLTTGWLYNWRILEEGSVVLL